MWCDTIGRKDAGTKQTVGTDLKTAIPGLHIKRPRAGDDRYREYEGIALKAQEEMS